MFLTRSLVSSIIETGKRLHIIGTLIGGWFGNGFLAHAANHLVYRFVFVRFHPGVQPDMSSVALSIPFINKWEAIIVTLAPAIRAFIISSRL